MRKGKEEEGGAQKYKGVLYSQSSSKQTTTTTWDRIHPFNMFSAIRSFTQSNSNHSTFFFNLNYSLIGLILGLAFYRLIKDRSDPYHCKALLNSGYWLDGSEHTNWQPQGCMLYPYKPKSVKECLTGRSVIFIGDSVTRVLFYGAIKTIDPSITSENQAKHSNRILQVNGIDWQFIWDPFLNSTTWSQIISRNYLSLQNQDQLHHPPALLVIGSGLWYLRQQVGIEAWKEKIDQLFQLSSTRLDHQHGRLSDQIVLLPVEYPAVEKLNQIRKATILPSQVDEMNAYTLQKAEAHLSSPIMIPTVMNLMATQADSETKDGLHYSNRLASIQARILFNLRCNNQLLKKFPLDKTCCFQYPRPNWIQYVMILFLVIWAPFGLYIHQYPNSSLAVHSHLFPSKDQLNPLILFGSSIILIFLSDRTRMFNKEQKQFDRLQFGSLNLLALLLGLLSGVTSEKGDLGFLNREQTDEWKGWMQIAILIYHYLAASQVSGIYNPIRICVASYLFMTGYGHFTYYYRKKDFSFPRILSVLVRLNLLTLVLAYMMDTDYLSYYFSPLVSMWFIVIWGTMYVGHQWNDRLTILVPKLGCSAVLMTGFFRTEGALEFVFDLINGIFGTGWVASEWRFRVSLDLYIVYCGMIVALVYIKLKEHKLLERDPQQVDQVRQSAIWLSLVGLLWFFWFELSRPNKLVYNRYHPYISPIPVVAFVILRNSTEFLRATNCRLFMFIGQCSLETFIIQFHFWLAGDTKGILKMLPFERHRLLNFIVSTIVFVFISHQVSQSTGVLTNWICFKPPASPTAANGRTVTGAHGEEGTDGSRAPEPPHHHVTTGPSTSYNALPSTDEFDLEKQPVEQDGNHDSAHPSSSMSFSTRIFSWIAHFRSLYASHLPLRALTWLVSFWILNLLTPAKSSKSSYDLPLFPSH